MQFVPTYLSDLLAFASFRMQALFLFLLVRESIFPGVFGYITFCSKMHLIDIAFCTYVIPCVAANNLQNNFTVDTWAAEGCH